MMALPRPGGRGAMAAWPPMIALSVALTALAACTATTASPGPQRAQLAAAAAPAAGEAASLPAPVR
ncbi:MAG TPA: hypothetical protein VHG92_14760, partial [Afifellaceae bacterium]|nr:hypothetical protein [Afifellaceae bacterium]